MSLQRLTNFSSCPDVKMQSLRSKIEYLSCLEVDIIAILQDAEFRTSKKRKREVENWLDNVKKKKNEFQSLERDVQETSTVFQKSRMEKCVEKMICEVTELIERGKFPKGLLLDVHDTKAMPLLTEKLIGQQFEQNLERVQNYLMKYDITRIGIYGMGGSGKTTLATHIHNLLLRADVHVHWLTVSQEWSVDKLQNDIANILGLDLSRDNERKKKAAKISQGMTRMKKCVLILDDVWEMFSLLDVGIPCSKDGCKLIFTTRSLEVCRKMECIVNIKVRPLLEEEAWNLFVEKLVPEGGELPWQKNPEITEIAISIAKKCRGLPLGIRTMGGSMRGVDDVHEWRSALEALKEFMMRQKDMGPEVFPILKFSYSRLRGELQRCFLYCALYHEDCEIERNELIEKLIAGGLIDKRKMRQALFDKGHAMLNELENACLLESCEKNVDCYGYQLLVRSVKMHDLMREMALEIASCRFMVKARLHLLKIPEEKEWTKDLESVSLMDNCIEYIPTGMSPRCPRLSTLILKNNRFLKRIPYSFFVEMSALRVLDLSKTGIVDLPSSVSNLEYLTALFLRWCRELRYVPPLGKLRELQLLDLSGSCIKEVPQGMDMLVNLKCLYMEGFSSSLKVLPRGISPELQDLRTGSIKVRGEELERLGQLEEFEGWLCSMSDFNRFVKSNQYRQLNTCRLHVGNYVNDEAVFKYEKVVKFRNCSLKNEGEDGPLLLPHNIQHLEICGCRDVRSLCDVSHSLSGVIKYRGGVSATTPATLSNLKVLVIVECQEMKKLLTPRLLQHLPNLESIIVSKCYQMEEIIGDDEDEILMGTGNNDPSSSTSSTFLTFPKLSNLYLRNLPKLESICRGLMDCDSLEVVDIWGCPKLKRLPFSLPLINGQPSPPASLKKIQIHYFDKGWFEEGWWESLEWDHPNAKDVLQPFVIHSW